MAIPGNLLSITTESIDPNTSGWRARLNCTLTLGSGGRNGDGALALTATAAGEMQAETAATYPVTAGETYYTLADASSGTQPERIGIEWLDETSAPVGTPTWALTTETADASWHRVSVAGVAPAGAARARVVTSATVATGGDVHYFENVYLGRPIRTTGNLLSFNAESGGELDDTAWAAETNCSVTRTVAALSWAVGFYLGGGHLIAATVTGDGDAALSCVERPAAREGTEYLGYLYLGPPTAAADTWVELRFHDVDGTQLSATRAYLDQTSTGIYRQRVSATAPAGTATCSLAAGVEGALAAQELHVEGAVLTADPVTRTGSVVPYTEASFEQGAAGWSIISGPAGIARSSPWGAAAIEGSYSLTVTSAIAAASVLRSARLDLGDAVSAGLAWRSELYTDVTAGGWTIRRRIRWCDAAGIELGTGSGSTGDVPEPGWWRLSNSYTPPAGATEAELEYELTATATDSVLQIDRVALWLGLPVISVVADDSTARITLTLRELTSGQLATVWRVGPDGSRTVARGHDGLLSRTPLTSDVLFVEDYEAPLGVPVSYYVETYHADTGALSLFRSSSTVTLAVSDRNLCWIKDPSVPRRSIRLRAAAAPDWTRPVHHGVHEVRGRRNPVILSDVRGGLSGDLHVWTEDDEQRKGLHFALDPDHVMLLQFAPGLGLEDLYAHVGEVTEPRVDAYGGNPRRRWLLPLTQVDRPIGGIAGTVGWSVRDVLAEHATALDVRDSYATVLDLALGQGREA